MLTGLYHTLDYFLGMGPSALRAALAEWVRMHADDVVNGVILKEWILMECEVDTAQYVAGMGARTISWLRPRSW